MTNLLQPRRAPPDDTSPSPDSGRNRRTPAGCGRKPRRAALGRTGLQEGCHRRPRTAGRSDTYSAIIAARIEVDEPRLLALDPTIDLPTIRAHLSTIPPICEGVSDAGPIAALPARQRFYWLVSPRTTVIQVSPVHTGRTTDPVEALERLMTSMVRPPKAAPGS